MNPTAAPHNPLALRRWCLALLARQRVAESRRRLGRRGDGIE